MKTFLVEINFEDGTQGYRLAEAGDDSIVHEIIYNHFVVTDNMAMSITIINDFNPDVIVKKNKIESINTFKIK